MRKKSNVTSMAEYTNSGEYTDSAGILRLAQQALESGDWEDKKGLVVIAFNAEDWDWDFLSCGMSTLHLNTIADIMKNLAMRAIMDG